MTKIMRQANTQIALIPQKPLTTEEFIKRAIKIHGDKYTYKNVKYINTKTKISITCPKHGDFLQTPNSHIAGSGCNKCNKWGPVKNEDFIKRIKLIYKDLYDYSLVKYTKRSDNVILICKKHGKFEKTANQILTKFGYCPSCFDTKKFQKRFNTSEFVKRSKLKHGKFYNYNKVVYKNSKKPVIITCPKHGDFTQVAIDHLKGRGCTKCHIEKITGTKEKFIKNANKLHKNKFDYSKVVYKRSNIKVVIGCPVHGDFKQTPNHHLNYNGCPKCSKSKGENKIIDFLIKNNILFNAQQTFKACKYIHLLRFDFYLPKYNLCIEFDGKQHFKPNNFFGGISGFLETVRKDTIKNYFCEDNKIDLLRISYKEFNKIEDILSKKLKLGEL